MSPQTTHTVIQLPSIQVFIKQQQLVDKIPIVTELELAERFDLLDTKFKQVPTEPNLWALTISAGNHKRCILAHWDPHQVGTSYVVCTHVFLKGSGPIPRSELDKALRLYQLHKSMGGV